MLHSISAVSTVDVPHYVADNGTLVVMEGLTHVPFAIARVFSIIASVGAVRGQHAHRACSQILICPIGRVEVQCDDGHEVFTYILDRPYSGLLVPPSIWAKQTFLALGSVLTVLCDRPYEVDDYIRDYVDFKRYRRDDGTY